MDKKKMFYRNNPNKTTLIKKQAKYKPRIKQGLFKLKSRSKTVLITGNQHAKTLSFFFN
jgi:hypothetical protein